MFYYFVVLCIKEENKDNAIIYINWPQTEQAHLCAFAVPFAWNIILLDLHKAASASPERSLP